MEFKSELLGTKTYKLLPHCEHVNPPVAVKEAKLSPRTVLPEREKSAVLLQLGSEAEGLVQGYGFVKSMFKEQIPRRAS